MIDARLYPIAKEDLPLLTQDVLLSGNPPHPHCLKWWEVHQQQERKP